MAEHDGSGDSEALTLVKYNNPVLVIKHPEKSAENKVRIRFIRFLPQLLTFSIV